MQQWENIFQFRLDMIRCISLKNLPVCDVGRKNNLLSLKLWFTETTVHQNNKQKRQKKASISISIIISSTISLKLLLTVLSFAFLVLWSMWQDAFMSVLKCNNAKKTISYGRDSETTWKKANEQAWLVGWLNGSNDHPIKINEFLNILKCTKHHLKCSTRFEKTLRRVACQVVCIYSLQTARKEL